MAPTSRLAFIFLVLGAQACGGTAAPAAEADIVAARGGSFACTPEGGEADLSVDLLDGGKKIGVVFGLDSQIEAEGAIDPAYKPRAGNANFVRFDGVDQLGSADTTTKI